MNRLIVGLLALGVLGGCGVRSGLERPDPMWGAEAALERECTRPLRRGEIRDPRCEEPRPAPQQTPPPQQ
jgi:hypothetical protein